MVDRNTFRDTGRARGVDDVGDIIGRRQRERGDRLSIDNKIVNIDGRQVVAVEPRKQFGRGQRGDRRGVGQHELDPCRGVGRVDRHVGRPGLQHRQYRDDGLGRPRK